MSDEQKESRIRIEDLPQAEEELTSEEARDVKGGSLNFEEIKVTAKAADGSVRPVKRIMGDDDLVP